MPYDDIWDACIDIRDFIASKQGADTSDHIRVVSGREDFEKNAHGDWDAWQTGIVTRKDFMTGKPVYDLFIATGDTCGKATAAILKMALLENKAVFKWAENSLERIGDVIVEDPEDWANGYRLAPFEIIDLLHPSVPCDEEALGQLELFEVRS
tara:strand:+ start:6249 stop:6707 length:459 start_codon:yes stop_codon:yes gene_type:complete